MKKYSIIFICLLCLFIGCSEKPEVEPAAAPLPDIKKETLAFANGEVSPDCERLSLILQAGETTLLEALPDLCFGDFRGSECEEELIDYALSHPQQELLYTLTLPTGIFENTAEELDLSFCTAEELRNAAPKLRGFSCLQRLNLGDRSAEELSAVAELRRVCPELPFAGSAEVFRHSLDLASRELDLSAIPLRGKREELDRLLGCLAEGTKVDLVGSRLDINDYGILFDKYPALELVTAVSLSKTTILRTDSEVICCNNISTEAQCDALRFFRNCRALDLGHSGIRDLRFAENMPELSVLIVALTEVEDLSPLQNCPKLEYLEIFRTKVTDLTPLADKGCLKHLNLVYTAVTDISPLQSCPLERLWLGESTPVDPAAIEAFRSEHPDCVVNDTVGNPTSDGWRNDGKDYVPRYKELRETFQY